MLYRWRCSWFYPYLYSRFRCRLLYGIGGAPEGVISAAVIRALGGDMQARLKLRSELKE